MRRLRGGIYSELRDMALGKKHRFRTWARYNFLTIVILASAVGVLEWQHFEDRQELGKIRAEIRARNDVLPLTCFPDQPITIIASAHSRRELYERLNDVQAKLELFRYQLRFDHENKGERRW